MARPPVRDRAIRVIEWLGLVPAERLADSAGERAPATPTDHVGGPVASLCLSQQLFRPKRGQQAKVRSSSAHLLPPFQ